MKASQVPIFYHGTSRAVESALRSGKPFNLATFSESNVSLGGAYLTVNLRRAETFARMAAAVHNSEPIIFRVDPIHPLLPDEDWVVPVAQHLDESEIEQAGLTKFMADLFVGYDGNSLSDHYKSRYEELNRKHGITWERTHKWSHSARQAQRLSLEQILEVITASEV